MQSFNARDCQTIFRFNIRTFLLEDNFLCIIGTSSSIFLNSKHSSCTKKHGHLALNTSFLQFNLLCQHVMPALFHIGFYELGLEPFLDEPDALSPATVRMLGFPWSLGKETKLKVVTQRVLDICHSRNLLSRHGRSKSLEGYLLKGWFFWTNDLFHWL